MLTFILTIIVALFFSFILTLDATPATLYLGTSILADVPMFYVVFVSIIFGVLIASGINIIKLIQSKLTIFGKNRDLKNLNKTAERLQEKNTELETEKTVLKEKLKASQEPKTVEDLNQ